MTLTQAEIAAIVDNPFSVPSYPVHSQGVEIYIKLVTDASASVFGEEARDGYVKTVSNSRSLLPSLETDDDLRLYLILNCNSGNKHYTKHLRIQ